MKEKNSLAVLGILALLGFGYAIPVVILAIEDYGLQSQEMTFEINEIELNFHDVALMKELQIVPDLLMSNIIVERGGEEKLDTENYNRAKSSVEDLFDVLHVENGIEFEMFFVSYYAMMLDSSEKNVYALWKCYGIDIDKNEYCFWIDDATGKVVAFEVPMYVLFDSGNALCEAMENFGAYYGLTTTRLTIDHEESYKSTYWDSAIRVEDEESGEEIYLCIFKSGDQLFFNMYPGTISVYSYDDLSVGDSKEN